MRKALVIIGVVAAIGAQALAQAPARRPVTPEDLVKLTQLRSTVISPDGASVLYAAAAIDYPASEDTVSHLYLVPATGGSPRRMTASPAGETSPAWAPDGRRFSFVSRRGGSPQVFVMPADGGEAVQVGTLTVAPESAPRWSPDGRELAFTAVPEPTAAEKAEDERTGGVEVLEAPRAMPQLFTLTVPDGKLTRVTKGEYAVVELDWAPDSASFALVSAPTQLLYDAMTAASVRIVDRAGTTLRVLSRREEPVQGRAAFSPDGRLVAWRHPTEGLSDMNRVAVAAADGSSLADAGAAVDVHFHDLAWLPDSQSLLVLTMEGTRSRLRRLDLRSGSAGVVYAPAGVIWEFNVDRAGRRLAFSFTDPVTPTNPWTVAVDGTAATRLAELNPQAAEWLLPRQERFTVTATGGVPVEAMLDRTPNPPKDGTPPLMVMPHGGPDWMDQERFDPWIAYFTGRGYNVLRVNFRGSLGYGLAFYAANRGTEGFADYDDVMAAVDLALARGWADPKKLVIGGWSYGGCFTEWAICRTGRFRAAVVGAGVANYVSNYAQSDINHGAAGDWEFLGNPYDSPENYTRASAVFHIKDVTTPVLILHGKEDNRVPYAQGLELYRALKTTGKQVQMAAYPGEPHGFRKPKHRIDMLVRWADFYDQALAAHPGS
jgi:dipeptidyl aminopeptidase/acylaminoacyl peptidase